MGDPNAIVDQLAVRVQTAMQRVGDRAREKVQARLETPYPPASKPGEHPHKRTGQLRDGIQTSVTRQGDFIKLDVTSTAPHTVYLEASGRPVISDLADDMAELVIAELAQEDPSFLPE